MYTIKVNEIKINSKNAINRDQFANKDNHDQNNDKEIVFWLDLQIQESCFNP